MAQTVIDVGSNANDGTGDDLRSAFIAVNANFTELYAASPVSSQITLAGNEIKTNQSNADLKLTASGTGVIQLEGIQIRDNHIEGTRSNEDIFISASGTGNVQIGAVKFNGTTLSSDDSSVIKIAETLDVNTIQSIDNSTVTISGTLSADTIDTNTLSSSDSTAILVNDGLNVAGILSADNIQTNLIVSTDSTAVQFSDDVNINGTLTATAITGVTALTLGDISNGSTSTSASTIANLDTFAAGTYRSARYDVSISDTTNSRFALHTVYVTHDGTNAYITDTVVSSTGDGMATFTADIDSGNVRVRMVPVSSDSTNYKFIKTLINV